MKNLRSIVLAFVCCAFAITAISSALGKSPAQQKLAFWNNQKLGANFFNEDPQEQRFRDAKRANIQWVRLTYGKWQSQHRDFLLKSADDFSELAIDDLATLKTALGWAKAHDISVVIAPLSLPGARWSQNNHGKKDLRLWTDKKYWSQAIAFWAQLAQELKDFDQVVAYNLINEPIPEMGTTIAGGKFSEHGDAKRFDAWQKKYRNTSHDIHLLYSKIIAAIRKVDPETPIMLDSGWYAQPNALTWWPPFEDPKVLYAFHMYEPYRYTSHHNFKKKEKLSYPGRIPFAGEETMWDFDQIRQYLKPLSDWAVKNRVPPERIVASEFGCYRRNLGCDRYLKDVIKAFDLAGFHWAFYAFREDSWDGYDYELGTKGLGWQYWKNKEKGLNPKPPRKDNPLWSILQRRLSEAKAKAKAR